MNLKKLSVAAALSIGIMTIGGIAKADQTGAACPVCPPQRAEMPCPAPCPVEPCPCPTGAAAPAAPIIMVPQASCPQEVFSPVTMSPSCPGGAAPISCPIQTVLPNCAPNAEIIKRQAYAFPNIGSSSVVIPKGRGLLQIGGEKETIAANAGTSAGLSAMPNCGALTLIPKEQTGGAAGLCPVCPTQVMNGTEILRCNVPGATKILHSSACNPCGTGAAIPMMPTGAACPVNPCDPCNPCAPASACCPICPAPTGAACPVNPCDPCNPCAPCDPCSPCSPIGAACPVCPSQCPPASACCPVNPCDPCGTGFASQLQGTPRTIQTSSGLQIQRTAIVPVMTGSACPVCPECPECPTPCPTGGACPVQSQYPDVTNSVMSGCDISKLTAKGILAGYPDRTYKPCLPIMRDELASALVSGLELKEVPDFQQQIFNDVPLGHWANADIDKAYNRGLMAGYPNCAFKPDQAVSRAEALSTMANALPGDLSACEAEQILNSYPDSAQLPGWSKLSVAKALDAGLLCDLPNNNMIKPNQSASRADVASMLDNLRIALALEPCPQPTGAAAELQPQIVTSTIPTLKMQFEDIISARTSEVGDRIIAKTTEAANIDGMHYPAGTVVRGKVSEVVRPGIGESGAIRVEFTSLGGDGCKTTLPKEILSATVVEEDNPNIIGRFFAWPFSWPGKVAGVAGRTVGGASIIAGNTVENFLCNIGNGTNELLNLKPAAAGRSYLLALADPFVGVFDTAKTAFSGTVGVFKVSGDEIAYVVKPDGSRVAQINPNEVLSVAFGCPSGCPQ